MLDRELRGILSQVGLTPNEAALYLCAIKSGPSNVAQLARSSGIKRTTAYAALDRLIDQGLMRTELKGFKRKFVAESPDKLELLLTHKRANLLSIMPELAALHDLRSGESSIKYYQGLAGIKSVYEGLIRDVRPKEDYLIISDQEKWYSLDPAFFEEFMRRRAKLDINIRLLLIDNPIARKYQKIQSIYNETIRILPKSTQLTTNLVVIPKKVVIHQLVPPIFALVIENQSVVQMHRELFKILWDRV